MEITFRGVRELELGPVWKALFHRSWPPYEHWFLREGEAKRPGFMSCKMALEKYLPEIVPTWERLVELSGGGDREARLLSLYRPTPYMAGCSQAVWQRDGRPLLVRNYDYFPERLEGTILMSAWNGVKTIVQSDCLWGVLDGMNEHGLAVSLAFGGRREVGDGFGIPLVLRAALELCTTAAEARELLARVPTHMSYNVSAVDASGNYFTAYLAPDRPPHFDDDRVATNHQREVEWEHHANAVRTEERYCFLSEKVADEAETAERFVQRFLEPPVFSQAYGKGFGTLYTAVYDPVGRAVEYRWRNHIWRQSFDEFDEGAVTIHYKDARGA
ncbi:MAG: hypothetical protein H6509_13055 [Bryobacterales bacterium]|nr:hypothetical protein [Acidobacteriota bacterium]MCB9385537.1 hypothetical protein [Bryobacterales bacterium]